LRVFYPDVVSDIDIATIAMSRKPAHCIYGIAGHSHPWLYPKQSGAAFSIEPMHLLPSRPKA
jgi:hypothetical protein